MANKQCSKCKKWKSFSAFYKHPRGKNGLHARCKKCLKNYARKRRKTKSGKGYQKKYQQLHRAEINKREKDYRKTIKGCLCSRFQNIRHRCNDPKNTAYKNYGGRGIKLKFKSLKEFIDYVMNELQVDPRRLQIDRIDNNGHYEPGNIRFVTAKVNCNNRRNSK